MKQGLLHKWLERWDWRFIGHLNLLVRSIMRMRYFKQERQVIYRLCPEVHHGLPSLLFGCRGHLGKSIILQASGYIIWHLLKSFEDSILVAVNINDKLFVFPDHFPELFEFIFRQLHVWFSADEGMEVHRYAEIEDIQRRFKSYLQ